MILLSGSIFWMPQEVVIESDDILILLLTSFAVIALSGKLRVTNAAAICHWSMDKMIGGGDLGLTLICDLAGW